MDERSRFRVFIGIVVSIVVIGALFVVSAVKSVNADNWALLASAVTVCALAFVALLVARKRLKEMKSGIPSG